MDYGALTLSELKNGYRTDAKTGAYICNYCGKAFKPGQVYAAGADFYLPEPAAAMHAEDEHGNFEQLLRSDTKYNTLTENQKELLTLFHAGYTDNDIAKKLGVSASTARRQKFAFREKAKQAKVYLAVFERAFENTVNSGEAIIPIHNNAAYYDERYVITEQEKLHILETSFTSLDPPVLKTFSVKEKKKVVILAKIAEQFEPGRTYAEKEVNQIIKPIYEDYALIRRYLIMYGYMERTADGASYWLAQ